MVVPFVAVLVPDAKLQALGRDVGGRGGAEVVKQRRVEAQDLGIDTGDHDPLLVDLVRDANRSPDADAVAAFDLERVVTHVGIAGEERAPIHGAGGQREAEVVAPGTFVLGSDLEALDACAVEDFGA